MKDWQVVPGSGERRVDIVKNVNEGRGTFGLDPADFYPVYIVPLDVTVEGEGTETYDIAVPLQGEEYMYEVDDDSAAELWAGSSQPHTVLPLWDNMEHLEYIVMDGDDDNNPDFSLTRVIIEEAKTITEEWIEQEQKDLLGGEDDFDVLRI